MTQCVLKSYHLNMHVITLSRKCVYAMQCNIILQQKNVLHNVKFQVSNTFYSTTKKSYTTSNSKPGGAHYSLTVENICFFLKYIHFYKILRVISLSKKSPLLQKNSIHQIIIVVIKN